MSDEWCCVMAATNAELLDGLQKENKNLRELAKNGKHLASTYIIEAQDLRAQLTEANADNARLRHLLTVSEQQRQETMDGLREVAAARDAAEARLGEAVRVLEVVGNAYRYSGTVTKLIESAELVDKFLHSPAAKAALEGAKTDG